MRSQRDDLRPKNLAVGPEPDTVDTLPSDTKILPLSPINERVVLKASDGSEVELNSAHIRADGLADLGARTLLWMKVNLNNNFKPREYTG